MIVSSFLRSPDHFHPNEKPPVTSSSRDPWPKRLLATPRDDKSERRRLPRGRNLLGNFERYGNLSNILPHSHNNGYRGATKRYANCYLVFHGNGTSVASGCAPTQPRQPGSWTRTVWASIYAFAFAVQLRLVVEISGNPISWNASRVAYFLPLSLQNTRSYRADVRLSTSLVRYSIRSKHEPLGPVLLLTIIRSITRCYIFFHTADKFYALRFFTSLRTLES